MCLQGGITAREMKLGAVQDWSGMKLGWCVVGFEEYPFCHWPIVEKANTRNSLGFFFSSSSSHSRQSFLSAIVSCFSIGDRIGSEIEFSEALLMIKIRPMRLDQASVNYASRHRPTKRSSGQLNITGWGPPSTPSHISSYSFFFSFSLFFFLSLSYPSSATAMSTRRETHEPLQKSIKRTSKVAQAQQHVPYWKPIRFLTMY